MKISNLYPWIRSRTRYAPPNDLSFSDIVALKVASVASFCRYLYSFVYSDVLRAHTYNISPNWPASTEALKISFPRASWTRILQLVKRVDRIFRGQVLVDLHGPFTGTSPPVLASSFSSTLVPSLLRILAVSNLYRRCRTPPAAGQIIHYGARACTRHVARGEIRLRDRQTVRRENWWLADAPHFGRDRETEREREYVHEEECVYL